MKGILLVNLGTPDSPSTKDVRKYLTQFLNDRRVIDIARWKRFFLVNFIIVPFRSPKTSALYKSIWTKEGSPILTISKSLKDKLQKLLGNNYCIELGMRYQNPSIEEALNRLKEKSVDSITIIPLYPQYASSSTGSTMEEVFRIANSWEVLPSISIVSKFYDHPAFLNAFVSVAKKYNHEQYDHVLFSYHGLPERQIIKASGHYGSSTCKLTESCCSSINNKNTFCYRATCFETTRQLAQKLNIPSAKYSIAFQSRLGKDPWIKPYSDEMIIEKAKLGIKKMLVLSPAFVADCLETIHEIGVEYNELFRKHGGEHIQLVESLNDSDEWVSALKEICQA